MIFYIPPGRERGLSIYRTTMMDAGPGRKRGKGGEKRQERVAAANSHVFRRAGRPVRGLLSEGAATTRRCVPSSFDPRSSARISEESRAVCHVVHTELARSPSARPLARPRRRSRGPPSVSSHGAPGTTNFHRRRRDDDGGMFLPLLPPHRRGESRRRQHTVDTKNTGAAHTAHGGDTARIATDDDNDNDITIACVLRWFRSYTEDQGTHTHVCRPGRQVEEGGRGGWER